MENFCLESDIAEIVERLGDSAGAFEGKTILLTGGRGFLGKYFSAVFELLNQQVYSRPCKLIAVDNLITAGNTENKAPQKDENYTFLQHDVIQPFHPTEPIDYILHAAGIASPFYYRKYPMETLEVAVWGTKNMLELARIHNAKLLFFSSSEIYGNPEPPYVPTPESYRGNVSSLGPRACYDESKRLGETLCRIYHESYGVGCQIVRPFNVYGPGMGERDYRVLPNFASRIIGGHPLHVYGTGLQTRTFCYVVDAIMGFLKVLDEGVPGEAYNIGNKTPEISMIDLVEMIRKATIRKVELVKVDYPDSYPPDEPLRRCPDLTKACLHLNYSANVNLEDGLQRFFSWAEGVYTGS